MLILGLCLEDLTGGFLPPVKQSVGAFLLLTMRCSGKLLNYLCLINYLARFAIPFLAGSQTFLADHRDRELCDMVSRRQPFPQCQQIEGSGH